MPRAPGGGEGAGSARRRAWAASGGRYGETMPRCWAVAGTTPHRTSAAVDRGGTLTGPDRARAVTVYAAAAGAVVRRWHSFTYVRTRARRSNARRSVVTILSLRRPGRRAPVRRARGSILSAGLSPVLQARAARRDAPARQSLSFAGVTCDPGPRCSM